MLGKTLKNLKIKTRIIFQIFLFVLGIFLPTKMKKIYFRLALIDIYIRLNIRRVVVNI